MSYAEGVSGRMWNHVILPRLGSVHVCQQSNVSEEFIGRGGSRVNFLDVDVIGEGFEDCF